VNDSASNPKNDNDTRTVWLIALAAPREFDAAMKAFGINGKRPALWERIETSNTRVDFVYTGVGKANAAGAVARAIDPSRHVGVLSAGIAGALPSVESDEASRWACELGDVVCASESVFADDGVWTNDGFTSCAAMGFAPFDHGSDSIVHDPISANWLKPFADHSGTIACVSLCSGTDERAAMIAAQCGAIAEAMEGAAAGLAVHRVDPSMLTAEIRVISNTTGDRDSQQWDLDGALAKLEDVLGRIARALD